MKSVGLMSFWKQKQIFDENSYILRSHKSTLYSTFKYFFYFVPQNILIRAKLLEQ